MWELVDGGRGRDAPPQREGELSVIYRIDCSKCGSNLDFKTALDHDSNLLVEVEPCEACLADAAEKAEES